MSDESAAFYEQMRTIEYPYHLLADAILGACYPFKTVLDIGCGLGAVIDRLDRQGIKVSGWDHPSAMGHIPPQTRSRLCINPCDLRLGLLKAPRTDLVICTETAEHIEPEYAENVVRIVTSGNPSLIVWSAAEPGDEWEGHVNLQPSTYWIKLLANEGYSVHWGRTMELRRLMMTTGAQHCGGAHKFFVLE